MKKSRAPVGGTWKKGVRFTNIPKLSLVHLTFSVSCWPQQVARLLEGVCKLQLLGRLLRDSSSIAVGGSIAGPEEEGAELISAINLLGVEGGHPTREQYSVMGWGES